MSAKIEDLERDSVEIRKSLTDQITDKAKLIEQLEQLILDLRKSREDLALEGADNLEGIQKELDEVKSGLAKSKARSEQQEADYRQLEEELSQARSHATDSTKRFATDIETLKAQHSAEMEQIRHGLIEETQSKFIAQFTIERQSLENEKSLLRNARDNAENDAARSREELDRFQKAAMENETAIVTELKLQLARARESLQEVELKSKTECESLREHLAGKDEQIASLSVAMVEEKARSQSLSDQLEQRERAWTEERTGLLKRMDEQQVIEVDLRASQDELLKRTEGLGVLEKTLQETVSSLVSENKGLESRLHTMETSLQAAEKVNREMVIANEGISSAYAKAEEAIAEASMLREELKVCKDGLAASEAAREAGQAQLDLLSTKLEASIVKEATLLAAQSTVAEREKQIRREIVRLKEETDHIITKERHRADEAFQSAQQDTQVLNDLKAEISREQLEKNALILQLAKIKEELAEIQRVHRACPSSDERQRENEAVVRLRRSLVNEEEKSRKLQMDIQILQSDNESLRGESKRETRESAAERVVANLRKVPSGILGSQEEIERLEKIIEAQSVIIEEQKAKIKFWARVSIHSGMADGRNWSNRGRLYEPLRSIPTRLPALPLEDMVNRNPFS